MRGPVRAAGRTALRAFAARALAALAGGLAVVLAAAPPAEAQLVLQGAQPQQPQQARPAPQGGGRASRPEGATRRPATDGAAATTGARAERAPTGVTGRDLLLNGEAGRLHLEQAGADALTLQLDLPGTLISSPGDACLLRLGAEEPVPLRAAGRSAGLLRYELESPVCPITFDVVGDAVIATTAQESCSFQAADCKVAPAGLWGQEGRSLGPQVKTIERERGRADTAVRDTFRQVLARTRGAEAQALSAEQAGFSSARDMACRNYVAENAHGYCAARLTQARLAALRAKLATLPPTQKEAARASRAATRAGEPGQ